MRVCRNTSGENVRRTDSFAKWLCINSAVRGDSTLMATCCRSLLPVCRAALLVAVALAAGGCSTMTGLSGAPRPGYQKDGTYVLSAQEQGLGCRDLQARQVGLQEQLASLPAKAVQQMRELPTTVADAWGRLVGSADQGVPALAEYNEAKAESAALNESQQRKGCGPSVETASIKRPQ